MSDNESKSEKPVKVGTRGYVDEKGQLQQESIYRDKPITEEEMTAAMVALFRKYTKP